MAAIKAILLGLALAITAICGWTLMTLPCLPLLFISVPAYRFMNDCSLQLWYKVVPVSDAVLTVCLLYMYCISILYYITRLLTISLLPHYTVLTI